MPDLMDDAPSNLSIFGSICAVVLALIGLFRERRKYKADDKLEIKQKIESVQAALNLALEDGRITDAQRLQKELTQLWERYRKTSGKTNAVLVASALSLCLVSGCFTTKKQEPEYIVIGERSNIVEPGQELKVPPLVPPAKKWYLVDNVGLAGWLGIGAKEAE